MSSSRKKSSPSPKPTHPPKRIVIGAKLKEYDPPTKAHCDIKVPSQFSTIQAAIDAAANEILFALALGYTTKTYLLTSPFAEH